MNNKPVAWMRESDKEVCSIKGKQELLDEEGTDWNFKIPLYTHPAKTLTDEEIIEIGNAVTNLIDSNEGWIEFARAILRKAQEKC